MHFRQDLQRARFLQRERFAKRKKEKEGICKAIRRLKRKCPALKYDPLLSRAHG